MPLIGSALVTPARKLSATLAVVLLLAGVLAAQAAPATECLGKKPTIKGTDDKDELVGTDGNDVIIGGKGNDKIEAGDGDDLICGEDGNDQIFAGPGDDT